MRKNSFLSGVLVSTLGIIIVKIIGVIYVIPFNAMIGQKGGALYGYGYNIYALFLSISSAGLPFAVSKLTSEYIALGNHKLVFQVYKVSKKIIFLLSIILFLFLFILADYIAEWIAVSGNGGNTIKDISFILRLVSFSILVVPFLSITRGFLQGHKIITPSSISQVIEQLVRVIVILLGCYFALNIFKLGLTKAVGISIIAAFIGGFISLLYLQRKISKSNLLTKKRIKCSNKEKKEIAKKLGMYAIPFVIISVISNLYEITDMIIVQRVMFDILHIDAVTTESISSIFTIWGGKLNGIILSGIIGINTSLTPNIVTSFTKKNFSDTSKKINKSLEYILFITVPFTIFLSVFSKFLWTMFYGNNEIGISVYQYFVFYALFGGTFTVLVNILQSLSKYKEVIISIAIGFIFNILFDGFFMIVFHKLGLLAAKGAIVCGLVGYTISIIYSLSVLNNRYHIKFDKLFLKIRVFFPMWLVFIVCSLLVYHIIPTNLSGKLVQIPILIVAGIMCFGIYFGMCYFSGALFDLLPSNFSKDLKRNK